jgi:hypothetical protein
MLFRIYVITFLSLFLFGCKSDEIKNETIEYEDFDKIDFPEPTIIDYYEQIQVTPSK